MNKIAILIFGLILTIFISACTTLHGIANATNFKSRSWSLSEPNLGYPNYLPEDEIAEYDRLNELYKADGRVKFHTFLISSEIDCRNLIRHLFHKVSEAPGKSEYYFEVKSGDGMAGREFNLSSIHLAGGTHDPFTAFENCSKKEIHQQYTYSDESGYGEILVGDGANIIRYWTQIGAHWVKIGVKNLSDEAVEPSHFNDKIITEEAGLNKRAAMQQAIAKRDADKAEQKYQDSIPSDMTYDPDGNPEWGEWRQEQRQAKAAEQAASQKVVDTLSDPNSHIYQNNRAPNLAENYKPTPDEERYGTSYQEFSKPTGDIQGDNKYIPASKISTTKNNNQNTFSNEPNDSAKDIETPTVKMLIPIRVKVDKGESMPDKYSASSLLGSELVNKAHELCRSKHNGRLAQHISGKTYASGGHGPYTCNIVRTDWYQCSGELTIDCELP
jgi:hypothetical protein